MILDEIVASTKKRVAALYAEEDLENVKQKAIALASGQEQPLSTFPFEEALKKSPIAFICEVKKASPSKGLIAEKFDYISIAKEYEAAGADCISVLTEPEFFKGSNTYLSQIRQAVSIPLLRKDFVIDEYQIYEAKLIGADAILLIVAILEEDKLRHFMEVANQLGLSALVEVHDEQELMVAKRCQARIIGVNNRNLKDFTVDIHNSLRYRHMVEKDTLFVSESGIRTAGDIRELVKASVNAVLIGETLMRSEDKAAMLKALCPDML